MPTNLPVEYYKLEEKYQEAKNKETQIKLLQQMLTVMPKHKGTESLIGDIKAKISKLKKEITFEAKKKRSLSKKGIRKEGAAQVCLVGLPNTGKSYIMNKFCNKDIDSTKLPFETTKPEVGMLDYHGIKIQLIEIPSIHPGFNEKRGELRALIHTCDALVLTINSERDIEQIRKEVELIDKPSIRVEFKNLESFKERIWKLLGLIKVYTKQPNKQKPEDRPIAMKKNSTVEDLGNQIHKDFIQKFKFAKIIRPKAKVKEKQVGLNFKLKNNDIVEFHTK